MKVVLQHKLSLLYFGNDGNWIADQSEARDFGASLKAMDFLQLHGLKQVHVVLKFEDARYDIVLQSFAQPTNRANQNSRL